LGFASYLRIDAPGGVIEVGSIVFSPALQRTRSATEAIYLMIDNAFELGYRRCEWKCDDLNAASRRAAKRFGFRYEGTFLQGTHYKGRSRDTAWYAITDRQWPGLKAAFESWLDPMNFDDTGEQRTTLESLR
ncbi:MAG: GNAT family N-acetyltransferase, partial [Acidimicrobiia bacterium]|nr:GNAT family N-acetyltransferase [Acidimicrobiia bacterium]